MYETFKSSVLGKVIGDGQCVALVVNNSNAYVEALFPGVNWTTVMAPVSSAFQLAGRGNAYLQWIPNDHNDPNQLPEQGDIGVSGPTPQAGYSNTFPNPDGHCWIFDSATPSGYGALQQNAPAFGQSVNVTEYAWKFRPVLGWYHPVTPGTTPAPTPTPAPDPAPPTPAPAGQTIFLPPTTGPWHLYNDDGPYSPSQAKGVLVPSQFGGLTYPIVGSKGNGIYIINTEDFGQGALWTNGSDVKIS